jgi:hypothetical protein
MSRRHGLSALHLLLPPSQLGHMSAFGGKADMLIAPRNVRLWPKADMGLSALRRRTMQCGLSGYDGCPKVQLSARPANP